jgi:hypothetical protein
MKSNYAIGGMYHVNVVSVVIFLCFCQRDLRAGVAAG